MTNRLKDISRRSQRRTIKVRSKINGTATRPRMHVNLSNKHVSVQLIDDIEGKTLATSSTIGKSIDAKSMTEKAVWVGKDIAKKAKSKKISAVVLDRGPKLYHGRIKALADAAREAGMEF